MVFNAAFERIDNEIDITLDEESAEINADFKEIQQVGGNTQYAAPDRAGVVKVGENLSINEDGVLSVETATEANPDNTKPITAAAVAVQVGNIEILLRTI